MQLAHFALLVLWHLSKVCYGVPINIHGSQDPDTVLVRLCPVLRFDFLQYL